jgi:hypothetical protein
VHPCRLSVFLRLLDGPSSLARALPAPPLQVRVLAVGEAALVFGVLLAGVIMLPGFLLGFAGGLSLRSAPFPDFAILVPQQTIIFRTGAAGMRRQPGGAEYFLRLPPVRFVFLRLLTWIGAPLKLAAQRSVPVWLKNPASSPATAATCSSVNCLRVSKLTIRCARRRFSMWRSRQRACFSALLKAIAAVLRLHCNRRRSRTAPITL